MSYLRALAGNVFVILFSNMLFLFMNFLFVSLAVRYLGLYDFGIYVLLLTGIGFAEQFSTLGLLPVLVSEIAKSTSKKDYGTVKSILYRFMQLQVVITIVAAIGFFSMAYFGLFGISKEYANTLYVFAVYIFFIAFKNSTTILFEGLQRFDLSVRFQIVESATKLLLLVGLVYFSLPPSVFGVAFVLLAALIAGLSSVAFHFYSLFKPYLAIPRAKHNWFLTMVRAQGIFAFFTHFLKNLQLNLYPWLVKYFLGVEAVGIFSIIQKIQTALLKILAPIDQALLPMISGIRDETNLYQFYNQISKYSFWFGLLIFITTSTLIPPFLSLYVGSSFPDQEATLIVMLFAIPLYSLLFPVRALLYRFQEQKFLLFLVVLDTIVLFSGVVVLASSFGLIGCGIAVVLLYAVDTTVRHYFIQKKHNLRLSFSSFFSITTEDRDLLRKIKSKIQPLFTSK